MWLSHLTCLKLGTSDTCASLALEVLRKDGRNHELRIPGSLRTLDWLSNFPTLLHPANSRLCHLSFATSSTGQVDFLSPMTALGCKSYQCTYGFICPGFLSTRSLTHLVSLLGRRAQPRTKHKAEPRKRLLNVCPLLRSYANRPFSAIES